MSDQDKPKIIIDEDWKTQVQAEKEAAQEPGDAESPSQPGAEALGIDPAADALSEDPEMPPASFDMLLTGLATEAMMCLGQIPHPITGETKVLHNQAKYLIDTIEMLHEKTQGNLAPGEAQAVETLLHQLRMAFVQATGS